MNILIGWDTQDITPDQPVELVGQYYQRISRGIRDPLSVTALAMEQEGGTGQSVMVSMDILFVDRNFLEEVRDHVRARVPGLDPEAVFLNATHIHSGPSWFVPFRWWVPAAGTMPPAAIRSRILDRVVLAVDNAWRTRQPGRVGASSACMPTGFCRRMLYADDRAEMYGETNREDFVGVESGNDSEVKMLFTWNQQDELTGLIVNVACPAQVMEAGYEVSGDFFGELRKRLHSTYGARVHLLAQVGAAGCQSPRNLPAQSKEDRNFWDESGVSALADRLEQAVEEGLASARKNSDPAPELKRTVARIELPVRRASAEDYQAACAEVERITRAYPDAATASRELFAAFVEDTHARENLQSHGPFDDKELDFVRLENAQAVIARYESQDRTPTFSMELHAVRLGDSVFVTNPFELFLDYGQRICARSRARRTFVVQLACDSGGYLPTARAVAAGGYSALIINGRVGPEGGRALVDATVKAIDRLWEKPARTGI